MIETIINFIANGFYKMIPAILSNLSPVPIAKALPKLNYPVDFNKKLRDGKRLFGAHKTWRGVIVMMITALVFSYLMLRSLKYGLLIGIGVIVGDLLTSVIKRRVNLKPGASFEPYDSMILLLSILIFSWDLFNFYEAITAIILAPIVYKGFNVIGYLLRLQKHPW